MPEVEKKADKTVEFNPDSRKGLNIFKGILQQCVNDINTSQSVVCAKYF